MCSLYKCKNLYFYIYNIENSIFICEICSGIFIYDIQKIQFSHVKYAPIFSI